MLVSGTKLNMKHILVLKTIFFIATVATFHGCDMFAPSDEPDVLVLQEVIIGTWDIESHNVGQFHTATGRVIINADGTFDLLEGSFAAIGMGSEGFCSHVKESQTFEILGPR